MPCKRVSDSFSRARFVALAGAGIAGVSRPELMQPVLDVAAKYKVLERRVSASEIVIPVSA